MSARPAVRSAPPPSMSQLTVATSPKDPVERHGVVGAGGAGFPTAVKLATPAQSVIVNAAECEPLLHKDKELLKHQAAALLQGLRVVMQRVGAEAGIIAVKRTYAEVMDALGPKLPQKVRLHRLEDIYPAGDEFILVRDVLSEAIPPGGLPKDVGTVVLNVETLVNIGLDRPVTHKVLTVGGAVSTPFTLRVPVGIPIGELLVPAGGATVAEFDVLMGGVMMGRLAAGLEEPVTKTLGGIIVLPRVHPLVRRYQAEWRATERIGKAACDQCRFCTELCPRYLLGHPIEPHRAMQALGFAGNRDPLIAGTLYCCECNLCSLYACPEDLDPKSVCAHSKALARELASKGPVAQRSPHPLAGDRRVPMRRLIRRLGLTAYRNVGPLREVELSPRRVVLPLQQHVGAPAVPAVQVGASVRVGDLIAAPPAGALGARIHASIDGTVTATEAAVVIETPGLTLPGK